MSDSANPRRLKASNRRSPARGRADGGRVRCAVPGTLALAMFVFAGTGCVLGPDYVRPTVEVPESYRFGQVAHRARLPVATLAEMPAWWRGFGDPELDALVQEGLAANHDLRIATARVDEFAARVSTTHAQGLPTVGYGASAGRQRAGGRVDGNYSALLSASWELDLWGRIRRENEAARANLLATEQARLGVALTAGVGDRLRLRHPARPRSPPGDRPGDRGRAASATSTCSRCASTAARCPISR